MKKEAFARLSVDNEARHVARELKREQARRKLSDTLDALVFSEEDDIPVLRLPTVRQTAAQIEVRDALESCADLYSARELQIANLYLMGYSPRAIFNTLGIPQSTGYRLYMPVINQLSDACRSW